MIAVTLETVGEDNVIVTWITLDTTVPRKVIGVKNCCEKVIL